MRSRKHVWMLAILVVALVAAMFLVAACDKEETATTATGETTATTAGEEATFTGEDLVIGAINSMTGSNALTGAEQKWAQEQAAADQNAAGGITLADGSTHKVVLQFADDTSSDTGAAAAMEKLIKTDGLKIVLSSNTTPYNQAAATVAEQNQAYFHINTSWTDEASPDGSFPGFIGGMDLQWSTDIFESAGDSGLVALHGADSLPAADQPTKWAVMTDNTPDGVGFGNSTKALLEGAGKNVVTYEQFVEGTSDFSSIIMKFQEEGVDAVVTLIAPTDGITFVRQCKEQNWAPKYMFGFKGFWPVEFYKALGSDADYICHDGFWTESYPYPGAAELGQAFKDAHNGDASVTVGLPYAAAQILFMAIEKAGVFEPGAVRDEVFGGTFEGTTMGDITYNDQGIADIPFLAFQWKDAEHPVVWPEDYATQQTELFVPWDER